MAETRNTTSLPGAIAGEPAIPPSLSHLSEAISEISWIAEVADTVIEAVSANIIAHERATGGRGAFGSTEGLNWAMATLVAKIHDAKMMAEALEDQDLATRRPGT